MSCLEIIGLIIFLALTIKFWFVLIPAVIIYLIFKYFYNKRHNRTKDKVFIRWPFSQSKVIGKSSHYRSTIDEYEKIIQEKKQRSNDLHSQILELQKERNDLLIETDKYRRIATRIPELIIKEDFKIMNSKKFDGFKFEKYIANILKYVGYTNIHRTQDSNDKGIDVIAEKDGKKVGIQCKLYKSSVGNAAVQQAISGREYFSLDKALVITNSSFTSSAVDTAAKTNVELIDQIGLIKMLKEAIKNGYVMYLK